MNLAEFLAVLVENPASEIHLMQPDQSFVPAHFHVTEVGRVQKDFIDCGGTLRSTVVCVLQVWVAEDFEHRLKTTKLESVIRLAAPLLKSTEIPVEVEIDYAKGVVAQFPISTAEVTPRGVMLHLGSKHTACLAPEVCGLGILAEPGCSTSGCC